jgi:Holliday junction resolvase RusA-like endonuclease
MITVTLPGEPVGKGRPRSRIVWPRDERKQPFIHVYPAPKSAAYEQSLAWAGKAAMRGQKPLGGALRAVVTAYMGVPASWTVKKRDAALAGAIYPTGRPDADNLAKAALDGLNGIVFGDDAQMVDFHVRKLYAERPRLEIAVEQIAPALWCHETVEKVSNF